MATPIVRGALFFSSYAPVTLIFAVRCWDSDIGLSLWLGALTLALVVVAATSYWMLTADDEDCLRIDTAEQEPEMFTSYLLAYLLPVILVDLHDSSAVAAVSLFLVLLGILFVQSDLVYLNPIWAVAGFRLFRVTGVLDTVPNQEASLLILTRASRMRHADRVKIVGSDSAFRFGWSQTCG